MSKQKTVLFIPSLHYLSNPVFIPVAQKMEGIKKIYLDVENDMNKRFIKDYPAQLEYLSQFFDEVTVIDNENPAPNTSKFKEWLLLRKNSKTAIRAIKRINPDAIILGADTTDIFKLCNTFFKRKKVYVIQHSALGPYEEKPYSLKEKLSYLFYRYVLGVAIFPHNPFGKYVDHTLHFLWSDFFFLNPHKKYIAAGNPAWDKLLLAFDDKYRYTAERNIVCFATQPNFGTKDESIYTALLDILKVVIKEHPQLQFIIKVHPRDDKEVYRNMFSEKEFTNVQIEKDVPIDKVLDRCFLLITGWSITGYESIVKGIPVILGNPDNRRDFKYLYPDNIIPVGSSVERFAEEIESLISPTGYDTFLVKRKKFIERINANYMPISAEKIAEKIMTDIGA